MIGRRLAHFEITAKLGEGAMGEVYRALDLKLDREVALKLLPTEFASDPERLTRFEREAKALASLNHPNVAAIHETGHHGETHFLAMELVDGETLAQRLTKGPLSLDEALRNALGIARALEAAHARGIVHRDLKPLNIKITEKDEIKLLDFGLAKVISAPAAGAGDGEETLLAETQLTRAGALLGTMAYMSPEQIRGDAVDPRADIWAFGCVLFEMLVGGRPFGGDSDPETLAAILKEEIDPTELPKETPDGIRNLVARCLRKDRDRRLHHIADARIEIEEALRTPPSSRAAPAGAAAVTPTPAESVRRSPRAWTRVVPALLFLAAALSLLWLLSTRAPDREITERTIAVLPFETLGEKETTVFSEGIHGDMLTNLSKVSDLQVISRTSVMQFKDSAEPIPEIARLLGVAWILQGEVQQIGDQVKVSARLVDAREDRQVWAESYRRELTAENLFLIQGELTRQIADQLAVQLSSAEDQAVGEAPTGDLGAYRLYVQGRALLDPRTEEGLERAVVYFRQAIDRDPLYALAWSGLSDALALQGFYDYISLEEVLPDALSAARRALDLDPDLAQAHASVGIVESLRREETEAVESLRRSIELNPSFAPAHAWLGWVENLAGRPEKALPALRRATELNPLSPAYHVYLAEGLLAIGDYEAALEAARRANALQSDYSLGHFMTGLALFHLGRTDEAELALERALALALPGGTPSRAEVQAVLGLLSATTGNLDEARERLAVIDRKADPFAAGLVHAALGETDIALERFRSIDQWGFTATPQVRYFFPEVLGPLRRDSRFVEVLRQVDRSFGLERPG